MNKYEDLPIGIDLGTTFSCIGVFRNGSVEIIPNENGDRITPSVVSFVDDNIYVGEENEYIKLENAKNKIYAVKRIIGRNFKDKEVQEDISKFTYNVINNKGRPVIEVDSNGIKKFSPEEISAKILAKLKQSAELFLNKKIKSVVITVPAYFTERQKRATKIAGEIADLEVIKIINEPTAASLAYGFGKCSNNKGPKLLGRNIFINNNIQNNFIDFLGNKNKKNKKKIIVFDLGGGTLDVTLLELENDDIRVEAHSGIMHLGGEDFDNKLMEYCINQFKNKTSIDLNKNDYIKQKNRLKMHCEKAKIDLTFNEETEIEIESIVKGKPLLEKITRKKFEYLCESLFISMINPIKKVLEIAEEDKINIDEIILVGGSTRIPKIKEILEEFFEGNININNSLNPDEAVAYGATIECALEMGLYNQDISLLDVCPFSLGVATTEEDLLEKYGLVMEKVIKKGTKLPFRAMRKYTPVVDYQKEIAIKVYEGENKYVNDNFFLGKFVLENIPKKKKDEINIEITFDLDENSILTVTAFIKENKETKSIIIKNDKGDLSELEIKIAKEKNKKEKKGNLKSMKSERNYKKEIYNLINQVNNSTNDLEKYYKLNNLKNTIEGFIEFFSKNMLLFPKGILL